MRTFLGAACITALGLIGLCGAGFAQKPPAERTQARYAGGFHPDACRYPRAARAAQLSGCCQMDLEISPEGRMTKADGVCSDPVFLEPTVRCLSAQTFIPATRNGLPVRDLQHLEYEWRATTPPKTDLCGRLKTS